MMTSLIAALIAASPVQAAPADVALWRLDCGTLTVSDMAPFSDSARYDGQKRELVDSCYLVKHGDQYLLWDTGLSGALEGKSHTEWVFTLTLKQRLGPQLAKIGVKPEQVKFVGVSHYHDDHTGQLADFPGATLLIGTGDWEAIKAAKPGSGLNTASFQPWLAGGSKVEPVARDRDIFGDGSVVMLAMPGHTPGHHALLVKLKTRGAVMLTGDQFHQWESYEHDVVPVFNTDRADTLASHDRFKAMAANLKAVVVVQHEAKDVAKLPAFPEAAR